MSEWYDSQKKPSGNFRKLLQERIDKANPRRTLTAEAEERYYAQVATLDMVAWDEVISLRQTGGGSGRICAVFQQA